MSWGETLFLKKIIDGKKLFRASDSILIDCGSLEIRRENYYTILTFIPKVDGQVRLNFSLKSSSSKGTGYLTVYEDGKEIEEISQVATVEKREYSIPISVSRRKTYVFEAYHSYSSMDVELSLHGDIVDGSTFDYTIG
jgi:hypothetical protein